MGKFIIPTNQWSWNIHINSTHIYSRTVNTEQRRKKIWEWNEQSKKKNAKDKS